jgi:acyl transferase domain-containing protein
MMMEVTYEALENAGLPVEEIAGTQTGCFVGSFTNDYREMLFRDAETAPRYAGTGAGSELLSNRLSWFYDLRGPSMTLGTACSSSLVAIHQACQSLRTGESKMAIAGGVNIMLNPDMFMMLSNQQFLSPDGLCKSFDKRGDGYSRGEGIAAIILKPIGDAIRDGMFVRARNFSLRLRLRLRFPQLTSIIDQETRSGPSSEGQVSAAVVDWVGC